MIRPFVIGLGALPGAGKGELAQQLAVHGVEHLHVGTIVRSTARVNGFAPAEETREAYLPFWGEYSKIHGQDWLARVAFQTAAEKEVPVTLDGIRIPADAKTIAESEDGLMCWLEGELTTLAQRAIRRARIEDAKITTIQEHVDIMSRDLSDNGAFSMGGVRDASELGLLPIPEIPDVTARQKHYEQLAHHLLTVCGLSSEPAK